MRVVAKLGTSSLTDEHGVISNAAVEKASAEVDRLYARWQELQSLAG